MGVGNEMSDFVRECIDMVCTKLCSFLEYSWLPSCVRDRYKEFEGEPARRTLSLIPVAQIIKCSKGCGQESA